MWMTPTSQTAGHYSVTGIHWKTILLDLIHMTGQWPECKIIPESDIHCLGFAVNGPHPSNLRIFLMVRLLIYTQCINPERSSWKRLCYEIEEVVQIVTSIETMAIQVNVMQTIWRVWHV
jgi:hypothetical protein